MVKNTAGQTVSAQMLAKADGENITTGTTTVFVTIDNGTQTQGSVGSGAATHKGNGEWQYAPSQAETNGDRLSFVFTHTSGLTQTVQFYTRVAIPDVNVEQIGGVSVSTAVAHLGVNVVEVSGGATAADNAEAFFDGTPVADSVPADGTRPSPSQALYAIYQFLTERAVSGTTLTVKKPDGTTGLMTFTLNDATNPTSITRAT